MQCLLHLLRGLRASGLSSFFSLVFASCLAQTVSYLRYSRATGVSGDNRVYRWAFGVCLVCLSPPSFGIPEGFFLLFFRFVPFQLVRKGFVFRLVLFCLRFGPACARTCIACVYAAAYCLESFDFLGSSCQSVHFEVKHFPRSPSPVGLGLSREVVQASLRLCAVLRG